jgi:phospholipid transport system transporter-binding protein
VLQVRNEVMRHSSDSAAQFQLTDLGGGRFALSGALGFATAKAILAASKPLFADHAVLKVDFSAVTHSDSAGLALLLEWINWAKAYRREIRYFNVPPAILAIARISEVSDLLHAGERWTGPVQAPEVSTAS